MNVNTDSVISITEANQNFSKVTRLADLNGAVIILKNDKPRYVLMELAQTEEEQLADNDDLLEISRILIDRNRKAYEVLAK